MQGPMAEASIKDFEKISKRQKKSVQVATTFLVAGATRTLWIPGQTVCIQQLLLKPRSKAACIMSAAAYDSFQLMHSSSQDTLRIAM